MKQVTTLLDQRSHSARRIANAYKYCANTISILKEGHLYDVSTLAVLKVASVFAGLGCAVVVPYRTVAGLHPGIFTRWGKNCLFVFPKIIAWGNAQNMLFETCKGFGQ